MPRGDGTGPAGMGPMTGRAAGYCAGYNVPGYMNPVPGRGAFGRGRGLGRGFREGLRWRQYAAAPYPGPAASYYGQPYSGSEPTFQQELEYLKNTKETIQQELESVTKRIEEIEENQE